MTVPFSTTISELSGGRTNEALTKRLGELVARVAETGASGTLTLTIKVTATGDNSTEVTDTIKTKLPEFPRPKTMFFIDGQDLTRKDPRQRDLQFSNVRTINNEDLD